MSQAHIISRMEAMAIKPMVAAGVGYIAGRSAINKEFQYRIPGAGGGYVLPTGQFGALLGAASSLVAETVSSISGIGIKAFKTTAYAPMFLHMGVGAATWNVLPALFVDNPEGITRSAQQKLGLIGAAVELSSMYIYETMLHDGVFDAFLGVQPDSALDQVF